MTAHRYQITLAGVLGEAGRETFGDFKIESDDSTTVLTGSLDQAALYGALNRIRSLGLELVELTRISAEQAKRVTRMTGPGPA